MRAGKRRYDIPSMESVSKVVLDEAVIEGESTPYLIYEEAEPQRAVSE